MLHSEQNRIVSALNAHCPAFYPVYPLWCFLTGKDVRMLSSKELKRLLARVEIKSPKVDGKNLVFPVGIRLTSGIHIEEKIISDMVHLRNKMKISHKERFDSYYKIK